MLTISVVGDVSLPQLGKDTIKTFAETNNFNLVFQSGETEQEVFNRVCRYFNTHQPLEIYLMIFEFKCNKQPA